MSIIHDALKKVQHQLTPGKKTESRPQTQSLDASGQTRPDQTLEREARQRADRAALSASPPAEPKAPAKEPSAVHAALNRLQQGFGPGPTARGQTGVRTGRPVRIWAGAGLRILACGLLLTGILSLSRFFVRSHEPPKAPFEHLVIRGVMTRDEKNLVLINDGIYEIGEMVGGVRIVGISLHSIQVLKDGQIHSLKIQTNKSPASRETSAQ